MAASGSSKRRGKVLLVNPNQMKPPVAPLALDYLASALKKNGFYPFQTRDVQRTKRHRTIHS
jgi:hypothetical protein